MTSIQKVIKYLAIAFAVFLIVTIVSAVLGGLFIAANVLNLVDGKDRPVLMEDYKVIAQTSDGVIEAFDPKLIDIEISATALEIRTGEKFKIETNNSEIKFLEDGNRIKIVENDDHKWWFMGKDFDSNLIVYLPEKEEGYEEVKIKAGAGKITIDKLVAKNFSLEQGAGKVTIKNLVVLESTKLEGGAGEISIESGRINNLRANQGVGKTYIRSTLTGNNDINSGIGALELNLTLPKEEYSFKIDKGIGSVKVDNETLGNDSTFGTGKNYIKIDGGIGSITVKTNQ